MTSVQCFMLACRTCTDPTCEHECHLRNATPVLAPAHAHPFQVVTPTPPTPSRAGEREESPGKPATFSGDGRPAPRGVNGAFEFGPKAARPNPPLRTVTAPGETRAATPTERTADMHSAANHSVPVAS